MFNLLLKWGRLSIPVVFLLCFNAQNTSVTHCILCIRYDEELALADAREREVKSRTGHRGKPKTEPRKPVSWK